MRIVSNQREDRKVEKGSAVSIIVNGEPIDAYLGETIASALLANGIRYFRHTQKKNHLRGIYCGMGICYECLVTVDGVRNIRACMTPVKDGMVVDTTNGVEQ